MEDHNSLNIPISLTSKIATAIITTSILAIGLYELVDIIQNFSSDWWYIVVGLLYSSTINEIFGHRICGHQPFKVNVQSLTYKILTFLITIDNGSDSPRSMALYHNVHHQYLNTKFDVAFLNNCWWSWALAFPLRYFDINRGLPPGGETFIKQNYKRYQNIVDDRWTIFCYRHQVFLSIVTFTALYFIAPVILFKIMFVGRTVYTFGLLCHTLCHYSWMPFNYKNTKTKDDAYNNLVLHYLTFGLFSTYALQDNHHHYPTAINIGRQWYEIDSTYPIMRLLKKLLS